MSYYNNMKAKFLLIFTIAAIAAGCNSQSDTANNNIVNPSAIDHSKMDHLAMGSSPGASLQPYDLQFY